MMMIEEYETGHGLNPYLQYLESIDDKITLSKIMTAIKKLEAGLTANIKSLKGGLYEYKINWGCGHRVYFTYKNQKLILILGASDKNKKNQQNAIKRARMFLEDIQTDEEDQKAEEINHGT